MNSFWPPFVPAMAAPAELMAITPVVSLTLPEMVENLRSLGGPQKCEVRSPFRHKMRAVLYKHAPPESQPRSASQKFV
jgi:hypothetical protein